MREKLLFYCGITVAPPGQVQAGQGARALCLAWSPWDAPWVAGGAVGPQACLSAAGADLVRVAVSLGRLRQWPQGRSARAGQGLGAAL